MSTPATTKEKLVQAALELFAEKGFAATGIREIADTAGVNSASIAYHFGDKRSLYLAVLQGEMDQSQALQRDLIEGSDEEKLFSLVRASVRDVFSGREGPRGQLALQEVTNPSDELIEMIRESMNAQVQYLFDCLRGLAPKGTSEETILLTGLSVAGQIEYYRVYHRFIPHIIGEDNIDIVNEDTVARHITDFTLRALKNL